MSQSQHWFPKITASLWIAGKRKILRTLFQVPHKFEASFRLFVPEPTFVAQDPFLETFLDALVCINLYRGITRIHNCALIFPATPPLRWAVQVIIYPCLELSQQPPCPGLLASLAVFSRTPKHFIALAHCLGKDIAYSSVSWFINFSVRLVFKAASWVWTQHRFTFQFLSRNFHPPPESRKAANWEKNKSPNSQH